MTSNSSDYTCCSEGWNSNLWAWRWAEVYLATKPWRAWVLLAQNSRFIPHWLRCSTGHLRAFKQFILSHCDRVACDALLHYLKGVTKWNLTYTKPQPLDTPKQKHGRWFSLSLGLTNTVCLFSLTKAEMGERSAWGIIQPVMIGSKPMAISYPHKRRSDNETIISWFISGCGSGAGFRYSGSGLFWCFNLKGVNYGNQI